MTEGLPNQFPVTVWELRGLSEYITYGRVVGAIDEYNHPNADGGATPITIYLLRVQGLIKTEGEQRIDYVKLQWPGSHLSGGTVYAGYPVLHPGDDLIVFSTRSARLLERTKPARRLWMGEHRPEALPYGIIRIVDGKTAPLEPGVPQHRFLFPEQIGMFDQPWASFVEFLKWGLRPENSALRSNPTPGAAGRLLRHD